MATIPFLEEDDASDEVKVLYQEIRDGFGAGQVPNVYKVLGNNAQMLRATLENRRAIMNDGQLDPSLKEWLAWATVTLSDNVFGMKVHTARLKKLGVSNAEILEALAVLQYFSGISTVINGLVMDDDVNPSVLEALERE